VETAPRVPLKLSIRQRVAGPTALLLLVGSVLACGGDGPSVSEATDILDRPHRHVADALPNVILIVLDTARADRASYHGYGRATTPHIDRFALDGVIYQNAHSVAPWTLPSHMSMFTGLLPGQHGATWRAFGDPDDMSMKEILNRSFSLEDPSRLLPERMRRLGYSTVGFTSNAWISRRTGFDTGFDSFYEMWNERKGLRTGYGSLPPEIRTSPELDRGDAGLVLLKFKQHVVDCGGELREPFFLFFNFIDPHYPYSPPGLFRYAFSGDRRLGEAIAGFEFDEMAMVAGDRPVDVASFNPFYDAEISYVDFIVGRLLSWLREKAYYEESLIVITSDHGEHLGEQGFFSHQLSVEEELLRIPLVIKFPGSDQRGLIVENPLVSILDIYETILNAVAPDRERKRATLSRDLGDMESFDRSYLIAEYYYSTPYLRQHHEKRSSFPLDEHRVTRRVVYDRDGRYVFVERREGESPTVDASDEPGRQRAAEVLSGYLKTLDSGLFQGSDEALDEETLERLRSLGYVD
jgi:arylsulfatase A-like enzyme